MDTCRALIGTAYCGEPATGAAEVGPIHLGDAGVHVRIPMCQDHLHLLARGILPMPVCADCRWRLRPGGS